MKLTPYKDKKKKKETVTSFHIPYSGVWTLLCKLMMELWYSIKYLTLLKMLI